MSQHARLSPSNHRWPRCPGSVWEEARYPDIPGDAAIDGTGSHVLLELCLINNVPASEYNGLIIGDNHHDKPAGWLVDNERCNRVQICLDYVERRKTELQQLFKGCVVTVEAESKSNPGVYFNRTDWWGTCDITIIARDQQDTVLFIEVVDYKDGRGYVSEKWNSQLTAYLFGKIIENCGGEVPHIGMRMTIVQPKTNTPIRYMCSTTPDNHINAESLMSEIKWLSECAADTDNPFAPLISGKWCQWCSHNPKRDGTCTVMVEESIETISDMTKDLVISDSTRLLDIIRTAVSDVKLLTSDQLSKVLDAESGFQAAFDKIRDEIKDRIETGETVPGYAMVPGRISRVWSEPEDVIVKKLKAKKLKKDQIYPAKLVTPAAALKTPGLTPTQKKKIAEELISEVAGKMSLKKVEYDHKDAKDVNTMFNDVDPAIIPEPPVVSFF